MVAVKFLKKSSETVNLKKSNVPYAAAATHRKNSRCLRHPAHQDIHIHPAHHAVHAAGTIVRHVIK